MEDFVFYNASSLPQALELLWEHRQNARAVAGGTNLMVDIHLEKCTGAALINLREVEELTYLRMEEGLVHIGAGTTIAALSQSRLLMAKAPALFQAANVFADPTVRHSATVGGNLATASPSADTAPPLLALDAVLTLERLGGRRTVPIREFFLGVGKTVLEPGELICDIAFPPAAHSAFYKLGLRNAMAISVVNLAASVERGADGVITRAAVALGSVAPKPVRAPHAEAALMGAAPTEAALQAAMEALGQDISPITDLRASGEYRRITAANLLRRVVRRCCGICENEEGAQE